MAVPGDKYLTLVLTYNYMKQYGFLILAIVALSSCGRPTQRKNEITKIEIAAGGCFGPCQLTVVSIDGSLDYRYFGGETPFFLSSKEANKGKLKGYYSGKVSQGYWDTLNIKLEHINYKQLDSSYQHSIDDQSLEVIIHYGNKIKHVKAQSASLPDSVAQVFYDVINSYKIIKPKPTRDTFKFESTVLRPVPLPDMREVKFPPPGKK